MIALDFVLFSNAQPNEEQLHDGLAVCSRRSCVQFGERQLLNRANHGKGRGLVGRGLLIAAVAHLSSSVDGLARTYHQKLWNWSDEYAAHRDSGGLRWLRRGDFFELGGAAVAERA